MNIYTFLNQLFGEQAYNNMAPVETMRFSIDLRGLNKIPRELNIADCPVALTIYPKSGHTATIALVTDTGYDLLKHYPNDLKYVANWTYAGQVAVTASYAGAAYEYDEIPHRLLNKIAESKWYKEYKRHVEEHIFTAEWWKANHKKWLEEYKRCAGKEYQPE